MKILFINNFFHHKNEFAFKNYKKIEFYETTDIETVKNIEDYDCVFSPSTPIDVSLYPNTRFIFGPHFSVFPDSRFAIIKGDNSVYNLLSQWNYNIYTNDELTKDIKFVTVPFGVDTETFKEKTRIHDRTEVFIYYKNRNIEELKAVANFLNLMNINYRIFGYIQRYNEKDYIEYLQKSKFGIWVGAHESQGFALQEALSCNVPLLVWNIKSMNQEYGSNYNDIPATSIPYWDERCGDVFYNENEMEDTFKRFNSRLYNYKPREFILENLSMEVCEIKFIETIENIM